MSELWSSRRERRLWAWVLVVVGVIYTTLGLGARLEGQVSETVLATAFSACLVLVVATITTQGLRARPGGFEVGIAAGIVAVFVLLGVRMAVIERSHLMEYGVLGVLVYEALSERAANGRKVPLPVVSACVGVSLVGVIDECIQLFLPHRVFDWRDILFNTLAACTAVAGMSMIRRVRRRAS